MEYSDAAGAGDSGDSRYANADRMLRVEVIEHIGSDTENVVKVLQILVNSSILKAKSDYFDKLFFGNMSELGQHIVTVVIEARGEAAFLELIEYMYKSSLSVKDAEQVLEVLGMADRFGVEACVSYCVNVLIPMTSETAVKISQLPEDIRNSRAVDELLSAATPFLAKLYKESKTKFLDLPYVGLAAALSCDDLPVETEDEVFDIVLEWFKRQEDKSSHIQERLAFVAGFIRHPYLSAKKLDEVMVCNIFDRTFAAESVMKGLAFKAKTLQIRRAIADDESQNRTRQYTEHVYIFKPVKFVEFELPRVQTAVYMDLTLEDCMKLYPSGQLSSQRFPLGGHEMYLSVRCISSMYFVVCLCVGNLGKEKLLVEYGLGTRWDGWDRWYILLKEAEVTFFPKKNEGGEKTEAVIWDPEPGGDGLVSKENPLFIDGIMRLEVLVALGGVKIVL